MTELSAFECVSRSVLLYKDASCRQTSPVAGKLMLDQESLYTAIAKRRRQQQQGQQDDDMQYSEIKSLLDVESELPLTFALDTQMLPLPPVSRSDSTWTSRILEFMVFGS